MTQAGSGPSGARRRRQFLLSVAAAALLGACSAAGTASPARTPGPTPAAMPSVVASPIATTTTDWGVILDALPAGFPAYPGATDARAPTGPVTAALTTSASVSTVVAWYAGAMSSAGYSGTPGNPLEDGSVVTDFDGSSRAPGCKAQVTARPQGTQTLIVVLVSASCPRG